MPNPQYTYEQLLSQHSIQPDPQQAMVVEKLSQRYDALMAESQNPSITQRFKSLFSAERKIPGLYLWGSVGIGKTFLMDLFFESLPFPDKKRQHFHVFMRDMHASLFALQGEKNPIQLIAKQLREQARVLCFDEFLVEDIADAMLLGDLVKALFAEGVCWVTTSNRAPDDLYKGGLQRQRFLPAIESIKQNTEVIHLLSHTDYRERYLKTVGVYYTPLDEAANAAMEKTFNLFADQPIERQVELTIQHRSIRAEKISGRVAWFSFETLCETPRSPVDYLELSERFRVLFISDVPALSKLDVDITQRFIRLIDVLYDQRVRLVLSAAVPIDDLYHGEEFGFVFQRTRSRLIEMSHLSMGLSS